jgi:hypothetical protein
MWLLQALDCPVHLNWRIWLIKYQQELEYMLEKHWAQFNEREGPEGLPLQAMWLSMYTPNFSVIDSITDVLLTMSNTPNIEGSLASNSSASGESSAQYISQPPRCRPTSSTDQTENGLRTDLPEQQASVCSSTCSEPELYVLIGGNILHFYTSCMGSPQAAESSLGNQ